MYYNDVLDLIGNTPLMCLKKSTGYNIFAKAEFLNPGGSIKDRIAKNMLEVAESEGKLKPGMTIIEPTSGNTGIGLALCGVQKGYKVIIVMPENMSEERKKVIRAFGAELVLTDPILSIGGAVDKANEIAESDPEKYFMPQQFVNQANPDAHYRTTAVEMCEQLGQKIDIYVSGVGSGGTLQGIAKYLLEKNPDTKIVAVEPKGVSALHGDGPGIHQIQGIGDGFIPDVLDTSLVTDVVEVVDKDAIENTVYELLLGESSVEDCLQKEVIENLSVIGSNINLSAAEIELIGEEEKEYILQKAIAPIRDNYDFIIIDCPPSLSMLTINSMCLADTVLVPIQCEYYALEGLTQLIHTINLVQERLNPSLEMEGVVFTMYDARTNLSLQVVENVKNNLNQTIYKTIIPRNVRLAEAPSYGMPINLYDTKSAGAESYRLLAEEVIHRGEEEW